MSAALAGPWWPAPTVRAPADLLALSGGAAHLRIGATAISVLPATAPMLPGALRLDTALPPLDPRAPARLDAGTVVVGGLTLARWDARTQVWRPAVVPRTAAARAAIGADLRDALAADRAAGRDAAAIDAPTAAALRALDAARRAADAGALRSAVRRLVGRGPGLTPVGDDLLLGALAAEAFRTPGRSPLAAAVGDPATLVRTTALSRSLLAAAAERLLPEDVLLAFDPAPERRRRALRRLLRTGHSSGRAAARAIALALAPDANDPFDHASPRTMP